MSAKHTPGPWGVMIQNLRPQTSDPRLPVLWEVPITAGNMMAMAYSGNKAGDVGREECLANARLIAAAPDLLEALEIAEQYIAVVDGAQAYAPPEKRLTAGDLLKVRAAIAKAKGETE